MSLEKFPGRGSEMEALTDEDKAVRDALVETMEGVAERNGWKTSKDKLQVAATLLMKKRETDEAPIELAEAQSPDSNLMESIKRFVEARREA